jgi:hypothetical protein
MRAMTIEVLNHRITLALGVIMLVGMGLGFMDSRHASAMDVQKLTEMIEEDRIEELEYKIEDVEAAKVRILSVPEDKRTTWSDQQLIEM